MIEVRIPFRDAYGCPLGYVEQQLEKAGMPPYVERITSKGLMRHWWEDPPGQFVYQWIPYGEYTAPECKHFWVTYSVDNGYQKPWVQCERCGAKPLQTVTTHAFIGDGGEPCVRCGNPTKHAAHDLTALNRGTVK